MKERRWVKVDPLLRGEILHNLSRSPSSFHIMGSFSYKFRPLHSHILKHYKFCSFPQRLFFRLMQELKIKTLSNESTCFQNISGEPATFNASFLPWKVNRRLQRSIWRATASTGLGTRPPQTMCLMEMESWRRTTLSRTAANSIMGSLGT